MQKAENQGSSREMREVSRETGSHGAKWAAMHGGYFSAPSIADIFLDAVIPVIESFRPDAVTDLGGGTGFLLSRLAERLPEDSAVRLLNMDLSPEQLAMCDRSVMEPVTGSITNFLRDELGVSRPLFICRSVLHYTGDALRAALRHIRAQMRPGEWFIHQSGAMDTIESGLLADEFFELMGSGKWIPPRSAMESCCSGAGLAVRREAPVPPLRIKSGEAAARYGIDEAKMRAIGERLRSEYGLTPGLFENDADGFTFLFQYKIFVCEAV